MCKVTKAKKKYIKLRKSTIFSSKMQRSGNMKWLQMEILKESTSKLYLSEVYANMKFTFCLSSTRQHHSSLHAKLS